MGTLYQKPLDHLLQDLKVTVHSSSMVFPCRETERKSMFLSNIDQVLTFDVQTVHFFPAHKDFPPRVIAEKIRDTLGKILVDYDFLGGRLKLKAETGRLEIDCNGSGAGFVEASSGYCLDEIGDLVYPNPAFAQLACFSDLDTFKRPDDHPPLCILQVTSFKCGGFALGFTTNHVTFDGFSFRLFLQNLAAIAADKPLAVIPCHDRRLLAARSPPRVEFPHPELLKLTTANPSVFETTEEDLVFEIFRLSSDEINSLKEKAKPPGDNSGGGTATSFKVVTAFIWRCKALSCDNATAERQSTILYAVDIRRRLNPPLPESYAGNAVLSAYATENCKVLEEGPFWKIVERVAEGAKRITDEYARSAIDWGDVHKGFPHGDVLVSSWWKLGFDEVEYPWGKPRYSCPVVSHKKDIIVLFPDINHHGQDHDDHDRDHHRDAINVESKKGNGVNILVALPAKEMEIFETIFRRFLFG
ncbi:Transferase [Trema orientale]|uniref:Transferase n=1 Tax=Trema orientale TaxID=63057 RepID=A0A2P5B217_TREOI|nr:Transferase [Trema orientale]